MLYRMVTGYRCYLTEFHNVEFHNVGARTEKALDLVKDSWMSLSLETTNRFLFSDYIPEEEALSVCRFHTVTALQINLNLIQYSTGSQSSSSIEFFCHGMSPSNNPCGYIQDQVEFPGQAQGQRYVKQVRVV